MRIDHANGGIIRNLSEDGMALQAVGRLHPEQVVHLRFELIRPRAKFELVGQITWADAQGQAGLRFTDAPARSRRLLKDWILTDLLAASSELKAASAVFNPAQVDDGLVVSGAAVPAIRLDGAQAQAPKANRLPASASSAADQITVPWWPASIRKTTLARFVDALVIASAVLFFFIIVTQLTGLVPSLLTLACTSLGLSLVFALFYSGLCRIFLRATLGWRLAQLASTSESEDIASPLYHPR